MGMYFVGGAKKSRGWIALCAILVAVLLWTSSEASSQTSSLPANTDTVPSGHLSGPKTPLNWDFESDGALSLEEGWTVFRGNLLEPEQFLGKGCAAPSVDHRPEKVSMPDLWGPRLTLDPSSGHGVATYCREVVLGPQGKFVGFQLGSIRSVAAVYGLHKDSLDGPEHASLLYSSGDPTSQSHERVYNPATPVITVPHGAEHLTLVIQVANYVHKQGGLPTIPVVDLSERLEANYRRNSALPTALFLVLSVVAAATFFAGRFGKDTLRYNIFAFLSAAAATRVLFVSDVVWDYFPTFSFARKLDFEYLSLFLVLLAYYAFIKVLFRRDRAIWFDNIVYSVSAILILFSLFAAPFLPAGIITLTREPIQLLWLATACVVAYTLATSLARDPHQNREALFVFVAAMCMTGYEAAVGLGVFSASMEWSQLLVLFVTLLHVRAFQSNLNGVEQERDELNQNLIAANSSLEEQTVELKQALMRAEEAARAKSSFIAAMSHELRTPLNAIIGFSEMIQKQLFGPVQNEQYLDYASDINCSGHQLLGTINDILDLARIESGSDQMVEEELDLAGTVNSIVHLISAQAKVADVELRVRCGEDLPLFIGDARKCKQLLHNLMDNAIKFNVMNGWVEVSVMQQHGCIVLEVSDSGIGMSAVDIEKALSHFQQIDDELGRRYEGLGLGLSLVQALVEQHEGTLQIASAFGVGTKVTVAFPLHRTVQDVREAV